MKNRNLLITLVNISSFVDAILRKYSEKSSLTLCINFLGKKYKSSQLRISEDITINQTFLIGLPDVEKIHSKDGIMYLDEYNSYHNFSPDNILLPLKNNPSDNSQNESSELLPSLESMLSVREPLSLSLYLNEGESVCKLIGVAECEWRYSLVNGSSDISVNIKSCNMFEVILCQVMIKLNISPLLPSDTNFDPEAISTDTNTTYVDHNIVKHHIDRENVFFHAALSSLSKSWLNFTDLCGLNIKSIFSINQLNNSTPLPLFVSPLRMSDNYHMCNPAQILYFVSKLSLIPHNSHNSNICQNLSSILHSKSGTEVDLAHLLCSLLLGLGLDAYVAVGSSPLPYTVTHLSHHTSSTTTIPQTWVITLDHRQKQPVEFQEEKQPTQPYLNTSNLPSFPQPRILNTQTSSFASMSSSLEPSVTHWLPTIGKRFSNNDSRFSMDKINTMYRHDTYVVYTYDFKIDSMSFIIPQKDIYNSYGKNTFIDIHQIDKYIAENHGWIRFTDRTLEKTENYYKSSQNYPHHDNSSTFSTSFSPYDQDSTFVYPYPIPHRLSPILLDISSAENNITKNLCQFITLLRSKTTQDGAITVICPILSNMLYPYLNNIINNIGNINNNNGRFSSNEDVREIIFNHTPENTAFLCSTHFSLSRNPKQIFADILENPQIKQILRDTSNYAKYGVLTKLIPYCDDISIVWVAIALIC